MNNKGEILILGAILAFVGGIMIAKLTIGITEKVSGRTWSSPYQPVTVELKEYCLYKYEPQRMVTCTWQERCERMMRNWNRRARVNEGKDEQYYCLGTGHNI